MISLRPYQCRQTQADTIWKDGPFQLFIHLLI